MKIFIRRRKLKGEFFLALLLFAFVGVIFYLYNLDISFLALLPLLFIYAKFLRKIEKLPSSFNLLILTLLIIIVFFIIAVIFKLSAFWLPAIGFGILITLLFDNLELSFLFCVFLSFLSASLTNKDFSVAISLFSSSFLASMLSFRIRRRTQIIKAGILAGLMQFIVVFLVHNFPSFKNFNFTHLEELGICVGGGIVSSVVIVGILPIFEFIFGVVTNISLLELSDFNHPLLRKMILEAPGTYQHSLIVANLAEAASEAIGANSLLARVGAYYHDIGKILKPQYFVENQIPYRDTHKSLKPSISKLIIINHVKEGIELAKKYRLNPRIIDFIQQHHGRSLVYYFYHQAKRLDFQKNWEEEFRYPGPLPQSKEVAIVALADTIEAVSRTLEEPTPKRIEELVKDVVRKKFLEGELDESGLTLSDLNKIIKSFIHILNATFHTRIVYPSDENSDKKSAKHKENKNK